METFIYYSIIACSFNSYCALFIGRLSCRSFFHFIIGSNGKFHSPVFSHICLRSIIHSRRLGSWHTKRKAENIQGIKKYSL